MPEIGSRLGRSLGEVAAYMPDMPHKYRFTDIPAAPHPRVLDTCTDAIGPSSAEISARGSNYDVIADDAVLLAHRRVHASGIDQLLDDWAKADGRDHSLGGRPHAIPTHAVFVALMLLTREKKALNLTLAAHLLQHRLSPQSRDLLGIPHPHTTFTAVTPKHNKWYTNTVRAFRRAVSLMDPYPQERYTSKTYAQIQAILERHDVEREKLYKARLDEFTRRLVHMTFMSQPRWVRRASNTLDVSFDQTYIPLPNSKGYSRKNLPERVSDEQRAESLGTLSPGPVEAHAGWHARSNDNRRDFQRGELNTVAPERAGSTEYTWGLEANLAVRVDSDSPGSQRFPALIVAASLSIPNMEVAEEASRLLESASLLGLIPSVADADMQYFANARPERLLEPALKLGFTPSTEYRKDRLGIRGGAHGLLFVEGDGYCPHTPQALLTCSLDYREGRIDAPTYHRRLEERRAYRAHVKGKAKAPQDRIIKTGKRTGQSVTSLPVFVRCPAIGPSPTVTCPLREMFMGAAEKSRPHVEPETLEAEFLDKICTQHSVSINLAEMVNPAQAFDYGSKEWDEFHSHARNTIESANQQLKDPAAEALEDAARRRVRGPAAAQVMISFLIVNYNLRKIAAWLDDHARGRLPDPAKQKTLRRRDRVWANRYTKTTGSGDPTIPPRGPQATAAPEPDASLIPMRT